MHRGETLIVMSLKPPKELSQCRHDVWRRKVKFETQKGGTWLFCAYLTYFSPASMLIMTTRPNIFFHKPIFWPIKTTIENS